MPDVISYGCMVYSVPISIDTCECGYIHEIIGQRWRILQNGWCERDRTRKRKGIYRRRALTCTTLLNMPIHLLAWRQWCVYLFICLSCVVRSTLCFIIGLCGPMNRDFHLSRMFRLEGFVWVLILLEFWNCWFIKGGELELVNNSFLVKNGTASGLETYLKSKFCKPIMQEEGLLFGYPLRSMPCQHSKF